MNGGGNEKRRSECAALPKGWIREEVMRKGGLSAGKFDVYYYPPTGKKVRSKPELIKVLGDTFDLSCFDYSSGTMHSTLIKPRGKPKQNKEKASSDHRVDVQRANRFSQTGSLVPPIRQTASIFKQPVTVIKVHESKVKNDFKQPGQEKPRQLFWEKRLNGIAARCAEEENFPMNLPESIKSIDSVVGDSTTNILLASISTALHLGNFPVTGQVDKEEKIDKNPAVFVNPDQPLISSLEVQDAEITAQEERVKEARDRLAQAIKALG
eukprot:GFUD01009541.1.p1 GENE.GFUD01009541.1~~GFUD01009541.1.p1  ORF type:complete len:267 (-),score=93.21 GFUD01009541.1:252-1052(-)